MTFETPFLGNPCRTYPEIGELTGNAWPLMAGISANAKPMAGFRLCEGGQVIGKLKEGKRINTKKMILYKFIRCYKYHDTYYNYDEDK